MSISVITREGFGQLVRACMLGTRPPLAPMQLRLMKQPAVIRWNSVTADIIESDFPTYSRRLLDVSGFEVTDSFENQVYVRYPIPIEYPSPGPGHIIYGSYLVNPVSEELIAASVWDQPLNTSNTIADIGVSILFFFLQF